MAWTSPMTAVAGAVFQAAQFNTHVRDNLLETAPAKATAPGSIFAVSATNQIAERIPQAASEDTSATVTSAGFAPPATGNPGPAVTVTCGAQALVGFRSYLEIPSVTARIECSYEITVSTTRGASSTRSIGYSVSNSASGLKTRIGNVDLATGLTPGVNTFTLMYNVSTPTGTVADRRIWVLPL